MDMRFATRDLRTLDHLATEVLVAPVMEDERPPTGVASMVDWRLSGRLSQLMKRGFFGAKLGEVLLLPTRPRLPFDKALLIGCGPIAQFDERVYRAVLGTMVSVLEGLRARNAVVELPGRHLDLIAPDRAVDVLLECAAASADHDQWTLLDSQEAQKLLTDRRLMERRRAAL